MEQDVFVQHSTRLRQLQEKKRRRQLLHTAANEKKKHYDNTTSTTEGDLDPLLGVADPDLLDSYISA